MEIPTKEYGLSWLSLIGQNINNNNTLKSIVVTIIYYILFGTVFILGFLEPILNFQGMETMAVSFDLISNYFMILSKMTVYKLNAKLLRELIKYNNFWPMNYSGEQLERKQLGIYNMVMKAFKVLANSGFILLASTYIPPLFSRQRHLPLLCYNNANFLQSPYYEFLYIWQTFNAIIMSIFILNFDLVFIGNITFGYCQLMMLTHELQNLDFRNADNHKKKRVFVNKLKDCVDLHNRIIVYVRNMNDIYSNIILAEILSSFLNICMSLYLLADANTKFINVVRCGITATANIWLLFIYCAAGSLFTSQYENIYNAVYYSNWYLGASKYTGIRNEVSLIMQISQKQLQIKAGGVLGLNMETFTSILRFALSFYTLLKTVS